MKKNCRRQIKEISYISNGKVMIILLVVRQLKKALYKMSQYFPKPYKPFGGGINVKVNLSNYAAKTDLKKQQQLICLNQQQNLIQLV